MAGATGLKLTLRDGSISSNSRSFFSKHEEVAGDDRCLGFHWSNRRLEAQRTSQFFAGLQRGGRWPELLAGHDQERSVGQCRHGEILRIDPSQGQRAMIRNSVSEQPRVLFCCFDVVPGPHAQSRRLTEYIKGLGDRFQVVVLSIKTADNSHIQRYHGARLLRVPVGAGDLPARVQAFDRAVRRQLESEEYLLVHFFDPFGGYALCERRADLGYRVIYDASTFPSVEMPLADVEVDANRKFIARMRRQELFCLMNADSVVVGSEVGRQYVVELGVPSNRVTTLHAPVDLGPFTAEVMGRPDGTPMRMVHLGSENPWAGLSTLVKAMGQVPETTAHLTVVGPKHPEEHAKLVDLVASLKLEKLIDFQEPVAHDDIHKVLATSDVGLLTMSDVERNRSPGGPLARLGEYLAAGRPVIAADLPLARELVPPDAAVFYRPDDAVSLADAIVALASDPARRVSLGAAGRQAALKWDASSVRGALLDLYSSIAGPVAATSSSGNDLAKVPSDVGQVSDAVTQLGARPFTGEGDSGKSSDPGTSKVKTDPAISSAGADGATDPQAGGGGRPPVMGTMLQDEPPVVMGEMLPSTVDERADFALGAVTDLEVSAEPVVMGLPVWLNDGGPASVEDSERVPWVDAPSPLPDSPSPAQGAAISSSRSGQLRYPFTPADGVAAATRGPERDLSVTPRALHPAFVPAREETSSVIVDADLLNWGDEPKKTLDESGPHHAQALKEALSERSTAEQDATTPIGLRPVAPTPVDERTDSAGILTHRPTQAQQPDAPRPPALPVRQPPPLPPPPMLRLTSSGVLPPPSLKSSSSGLTYPARSSTSGVFGAPANSLAGMTLPPISAPQPRTYATSATPPPLPSQKVAAKPQPKEELVEDLSDDVMGVGDDTLEDDQASNDEVMEADGLGVDPTSDEVSLPASALDPWLAQLVHGYCPPESQLFARHVPPTTMPGRD